MVNARTVLLANVDLYCTEEGDGPPLLVHHSGPGLDHTVIAPHLSPLAQDVRVVCFDHRGTGRSAVSQGPDPFHIDRFVGDIAALADGLPLGPFALLGHSFGGIVALHFALAHPDLLTHLILVSTPASHHYIEDVESALPELLEPAALAELASLQDSPPSAQVMRRSLELLAPIYFHDPARVSQLGLDSVRFGPETQAVWESLEGFDLRPRLRDIRVPALVIAGAQDRAVTVERARELADALPQGNLLIIEKSGHYPFIEAPDEFLSGVREFLLGKPKKKKGLFGRRSA
ncbi:MAG: alpha/beta fold hydrolase [Dehalococcoidia bacterium]|nr:alpha/beta fold hydrolase [Dehalococcoidia bacterium]